MYNIRVQSVNYFTLTSEDNERAAHFAKTCMKSFKKRIEPTLATYAATPDKMTCITCTTVSEPDTAAAIAVISKKVLTTLQGKVFTGNHYVFLMTHPLQGKKTSAHVGYSTNPMYDVYLHNTLAIPDRTTSAAAPHWILDMVLGPFISAEIAIECSKELVSHTRGKDSKRKKAILLSRIYNVPLYSASIKPSVALKEYLREKAPAYYIDCYEKMINGKPKPAAAASRRDKRHKKKKN